MGGVGGAGGGVRGKGMGEVGGAGGGGRGWERWGVQVEGEGKGMGGVGGANDCRRCRKFGS